MEIINLVLIITFTLSLHVIQAEETKATEPSYNPLEDLILNDNKNGPSKDHARMKRQYDPYYYDRGYYPVPIVLPIGLGFGGFGGGLGRGFPGRGFGGRGFGGRGFGGRGFGGGGFGGRGFGGRGFGGRGFGGRGFGGIGGRGVGGFGGGRGGRG